MPSEKILAQKQEVVSDLVVRLQNLSPVFLLQLQGITVADDTKLRRELREAGVDYFVVKNTLLETRWCQKVTLHSLERIICRASAYFAVSKDAVVAAKDPDQVCRCIRRLRSRLALSMAVLLTLLSVRAWRPALTEKVYFLCCFRSYRRNLSGLACALNSIAEKNAEGTPAEPCCRIVWQQLFLRICN